MKSRVFLPSIVSGGLLWLAFFPLDLGPVAYVAMAPFLTLVRAEGIGATRRYLAAFLGGLTFYLLALQWVRVAHPMMELFAWPGLSIACALFWPLALLLLRKLDRLQYPLAVTFPVVWVALEYLRAHLPTGYPFLSYAHLHQFAGFGWYFLGHTQHQVLPMIQAADLGGVYLISAGVAAVNGAAYEWLTRSNAVRWLLRWPRRTDRTAPVRELWITALAALVPVGLVCYGASRLAHPPFETGPRVAAVQGNLSQSDKILRGDERPEDVRVTPLEREYFPLSAAAATRDPAGRPPDLVVWPETCYPDNWYDATPELEAQPDGEKLMRAVRQHQEGFRNTLQGKLPHGYKLLGLNRTEWLDQERHRKFNSAVLVKTNGEVAARYDKMHLVPFGEYVPFRQTLPWMRVFTPYTHDYSCTPGESWTRFELPVRDRVYRFGVLICYEDTDPYFARQYNPSAGRGEGVDFLINISNDGWFDGTEQHEQHLAICRFRAVEARRSVVRAVNMGISAVIDPDGRVVALPSEEGWAQSKKARAVVRAEVPLDQRGAVYALLGDWLPALCWLGIVVGLVMGRRVKPQG